MIIIILFVIHITKSQCYYIKKELKIYDAFKHFQLLKSNES